MSRAKRLHKWGRWREATRLQAKRGVVSWRMCMEFGCVEVQYRNRGGRK